MPHVEPDIDVDSPLDSDEVEQGDDEIRKLKRQLVERLQDLINSITDDPWVLANAIVKTESIADGAVTGPKIAEATKLRSMLRGTVEVTATLAFPHGTYTNDYDAPGAEVGDYVFLSWTTSVATFVFMHAWVPEPDVIKVTIGNDSNSTGLALVDEPLGYVIVKPGILFDEV